MITVAVAGGAGNVGRTIVDALEKSPEYEVIVLTRKVQKIATDTNKILMDGRLATAVIRPQIRS